MTGHICPWWGGYFIDNRLRRLVHNPEAMLGPYVASGMTVMDVGCGMGFFAIALAKMVGDAGRVLAVDLQPRMLEALRRRAAKAGVAERIQTHVCRPDGLGVSTEAQFALAFAMVHEVPDAERLVAEIRDCLQPGGKFFVAEPRLHVSGARFQATLRWIADAGLTPCDEPKVRWCRAAVFVKKA